MFFALSPGLRILGFLCFPTAKINKATFAPFLLSSFVGRCSKHVLRTGIPKSAAYFAWAYPVLSLNDCSLWGIFAFKLGWFCCLNLRSAKVDKSKHPELWPLSGPERAFLEYGGASAALAHFRIQLWDFWRSFKVFHLDGWGYIYFDKDCNVVGTTSIRLLGIVRKKAFSRILFVMDSCCTFLPMRFCERKVESVSGPTSVGTGLLFGGSSPLPEEVSQALARQGRTIFAAANLQYAKGEGNSEALE